MKNIAKNTLLLANCSSASMHVIVGVVDELSIFLCLFLFLFLLVCTDLQILHILNQLLLLSVESVSFSLLFGEALLLLLTLALASKELSLQSSFGLLMLLQIRKLNRHDRTCSCGRRDDNGWGLRAEVATEHAAEIP